MNTTVNRCPAVSLQYFLNGELEPAQLRKQVQELAAAGYRCVFGHARQGMLTPYFSEKWWLGIDAIVDECRKQKIKFAIWDEDFYPSGNAGWRVGTENPEFRGQYLRFTSKHLAAGERACIDWEPGERMVGCVMIKDGIITDISKHVGTIVRSWNRRWVNSNGYAPVLKIGAPHWRAGVTRHRYSLDYDAPCDCDIVAVHGVTGGAGTVDFMNPAAVRCFIDITHEAYLQRYGSEVFSEVFCGTFMDEPHLTGVFPWSQAIADEYKKEFGGDLVSLLPHLVMDIDPMSREYRRRYRLLQNRLLCRNYLGQIQAWCAEHGIESAGHLTRSESLNVTARFWPNEFRAFKYLDLPCTDPLGAFMGMPDAASYHTGLKIVSSAAHFFGKPRAGSDALAVCGNETAIRDLRYMLDYQMVLGISCFILHGASQSWAGMRKDEVPPSLFYQNTEWELIPELLKHIESSCHRLEQGKFAANVAVFHYEEEFSTCINGGNDFEKEKAVHELSEKLLSSHVEFEFIDGETLLEQPVGEFVSAFPYLVLQDSSWFLPPGVAEYLEEYRAAGGTICYASDLSELPALAVCGSGAENIFVHRRLLEDGKQDIFLFNRGDVAFSGTVEGVALTVPPRSGCFADEAVPLPVAKQRIAVENWQVSFPENYAQLCCWQTDGTLGYIDLLNREFCFDTEEPLPAEVKSFTCSFLCQGTLDKVRLIIDPEIASGDYRMFLNNVELSDWKTERFYDENNLSCDITSLLRSGSTVTQNVLKIVCSGINEFPYLAGNFKTAFRFGKKALPLISGCDRVEKLDRLCDWSSIGRGTFSGKVRCEAEVDFPADGVYSFDAGRVEDAFKLYLDGKLCATVIKAPYIAGFGNVSAGKHLVALEVFNAGGNRDKLAAQPAGVQGETALLCH